MGFKEYLADMVRRRNEPDQREILYTNLLKAAKDVLRVQPYKDTLATAALRRAVEMVEKAEKGANDGRNGKANRVYKKPLSANWLRL